MAQTNPLSSQKLPEEKNEREKGRAGSDGKEPSLSPPSLRPLRALISPISAQYKRNLCGGERQIHVIIFLFLRLLATVMYFIWIRSRFVRSVHHYTRIGFQCFLSSRNHREAISQSPFMKCARTRPKREADRLARFCRLRLNKWTACKKAKK